MLSPTTKNVLGLTIIFLKAEGNAFKESIVGILKQKEELFSLKRLQLSYWKKSTISLLPEKIYIPSSWITMVSEGTPIILFKHNPSEFAFLNTITLP